MKSALLAIIIQIALTAAFQQKDLEDFGDDDFIPFTGERHDLFDWKLCTEVDGREPGNVLASPLSIKFLLSMLYDGTTGETARLLAEILQLSLNKHVSRAQSTSLLRSLQAPNPYYNLEMEMRIFVDKQFHPKNWYRNVLSQTYGAYIQRLDFLNTESAAATINEWVDIYTHGHIKKLISSADSLKGTLLMLTNAIYFNGKWRHPFPTEGSYNDTFYGANGPKHVRYMTLSGLFYYADAQEIDSTILRLPYKGKKFAMYIILPRRPTGLNHVLSQITPYVLRRAIGQLEETSVQVTIPSFTFDYKINFNDMLQKMGLKSLFNNSTEFHGISKSRKIAISNILQKSSIQVTEAGTIMAAVSASEFVNKAGISEIEFTASHPFLFYVEDESTGTVIFIGKYVDPSQVSGELDMEPNAISPTYKPELGGVSVPNVKEYQKYFVPIKPKYEPTLWKMSKSP